MKSIYAISFLLCALTGASAFAQTEDYTLVIKDHMFEPLTMQLPAGKRIRLTVDNQDATPEEFEGYNFPVEKVIAGHSKATVWVGPFEPGDYGFMGEFNADSAKGEFHVE